MKLLSLYAVMLLFAASVSGCGATVQAPSESDDADTTTQQDPNGGGTGDTDPGETDGSGDVDGTTLPDGETPSDTGGDEPPPDTPDVGDTGITGDPATWPRDQNLPGSWLHETSFFDSISGYNSTTSTTLTLRADGTFDRTTRTWASSDAIDYDSGTESESGHWGTTDGWLLLVLPNDDYYEYGYYLDQAAGDFVMMMQTEGGENLLWTYME